jgi:predicted transcriptional regulator
MALEARKDHRSSNPVVALATYSHLLTVLCSSNLEMFGNVHGGSYSKSRQL